jgi:hypothetical protein
MFCAALCVSAAFPGTDLPRLTFRFGVLQHSATGPACVLICVCVCVGTSFGGQLGGLDWKVGTHFWVFGQRSGPRADDPAFCTSKKMQQDHHRFLNYTGPRCEATLLQRSPTFIYRFIGLSLRGRARDLIRCQDNFVRLTERHWTSRQSKRRWLRQGDGATTERLANNFFPGG